MAPQPNLSLRLAITASGKSQRALAAKMKMHETRLSAIARGHYNPSDDEQKRIARVLKTTVEALFGPIAV